MALTLCTGYGKTANDDLIRCPECEELLWAGPVSSEERIKGASARYPDGENLYASMDYSGAISEFDEAIAQETNWVPAFRTRAEAYRQLGRGYLGQR